MLRMGIMTTLLQKKPNRSCGPLALVDQACCQEERMNRMNERPRTHSPRVFDFMVLLLLSLSVFLAALARGTKPARDEKVQETDELRFHVSEKA